MRTSLLTACALVLAGSGSAASAEAAASDTSGDWRGSISTGATILRIGLHLGEHPTFDSPDKGALGVPAEVKTEGNHIVVTIAGKPVFDGNLAPDGMSLDGMLNPGQANIPLHLERGVFAAASRPQTPRPPFPYRAEEVGFDNPGAPGVHLAGTLTTPEGEGPFPAVLLITGSGQEDRDETVFEHKPFLVLSDALTRRGIAVLRLDDRGKGGSTGASPNNTTADFVTDAETAVAWLRGRGDIDPKRIGLLGHSEGGIIAPIVASQDPAVAFVVMWASPGVGGETTIVEQVRSITLASGAGAERADRMASYETAVLDAVRKAADFAAARAAIDAVNSSYGMPATGDADLAALMSHWYRYFLSLDPAPVLREVKVPTLALLGSVDTQVPASFNAPALRAALADNPEATVEVLPGLNHFFQKAETGSPDEYGRIEQTIDPAALDRMVEWIVGVTSHLTSR